MNITLDKKFFNGLREMVILRDNEQCVKCGMTRSLHRKVYGRDITVDHKDGKGRNTKYKNNAMYNLQTLCLECHGSKDARKLNEMQALNIFHSRDNKKDMNQLCRAYGVNVKAGYDISIGKSWSKITLIKGKTPL